MAVRRAKEKSTSYGGSYRAPRKLKTQYVSSCLRHCNQRRTAGGRLKAHTKDSGSSGLRWTSPDWMVTMQVQWVYVRKCASTCSVLMNFAPNRYSDQRSFSQKTLKY